MPFESMNLKILLPFGVFTEKQNVFEVVVETIKGSYGILPNRRDCVAALAPGILTYKTKKEGSVYVAIDEGIMAKTKADVFVSVRNAVGGKDLGELRKAVEKEFLEMDQREKDVQSILSKLESGFLRQFQKLREE